MMKLAGVRRQLGEAREALSEAAGHAAAGRFDPAYRAALKSRNLLFHAQRGLAIARKEEPPEVPVVAGPHADGAAHAAALGVLEAALAVEDDLTEMPPILAGVRDPLARFLAHLRNEVARLLGTPR
jgi:hypothetical protein